jgi:hypothetical protein
MMISPLTRAISHPIVSLDPPGAHLHRADP